MISPESLADQLDTLSRQVASLQSRFAAQDQAALEVALSPADVLRVGAYPSGAEVYPAGTTTPGFENILADNSVVPGTIAPGAIDSIAKFASTIRPPVVVASLPVLPDALYPLGSLVYLTTDKRLYKTETGLVGSWVPVVSTADLSGTISTTQIADDSISTPKLKANVVTAAKIAAGTITSAEIAADTITAGQIAAGAIGATEVAALAITAEKLQVGDWSNRLSNPGFETGDTTGWTVNYAVSGGSFDYNSNGPGGTAGAHSGNGCGLLTTTGTGGERVVNNDYVPCGGSDTVVWAAWLASTAGTTATIYVSFYTAVKSFISSQSTTRTPTTSWAKYVGSFAAPSTARFARILIENTTGSGTKNLYFDDVSLGQGGVDMSPSGIAVYAGAITVTNAGATVIIDGTSDMFKIAATGTATTGTVTAGASVSATTSLTGLGSSYTTVPACVFMSTFSTSSLRWASFAPWLVFDYLAPVSGGATTTRTVGLAAATQSYGWIDAGVLQITCNTLNANASDLTGSHRYHVLVEAGI